MSSQSEVSTAGVVREGLLGEEGLDLVLGCDWNGKGILGGRNSADKSAERGSVWYVQGTGRGQAWMVGKSERW